MKSKTWIALLSALLAVCAALSIWLLRPGEPAGYARILSGGKPVKMVDLAVDQIFTVECDGGSNTVTVSGGQIAVTDATCPDRHCINRGYCSSGTPIVCLPNGLVIEFVTAGRIDGAVG